MRNIRNKVSIKEILTGTGPAEIDRTDRAILRTLQRDAAISNVALAEKVSLSAPACLRRVERLRRLGSAPFPWAETTGSLPDRSVPASERPTS